MTSRKKIFLKGVILAITKFMINPKISVLLVTNANSVCANAVAASGEALP